jgi:hypothetical protein
MLDNIKTLLGITGSTKDSLITLLISMVNEEILNYCNLTEVPAGLTNTAIQMVIIKYNRIGNEGIQSQSFNGAGESFTDSYPAWIISSLNRYRRIKLL